ncbi:hypothetical protein AALP_AAs64157U000100 [Arabis alpina]|uniref:Replication factor A C-terminal domain-containing protein n=1 Tax=Arabis alpina TaxID=50452 RepID=A0A087FWA7_ARAAL|nr:hypothetical protein AALP_AAs64157U000100 [Arabis alpina]
MEIVLADVIAQVSCIRTSNKVDETKTPPRTSFNLLLTCTFSGGETGYISVWEKLALQVSEELAQLKDGPLLVIATGVNPKTVGGHIYLNATASTRFFFNVDDEITQDFRKRKSSPYKCQWKWGCSTKMTRIGGKITCQTCPSAKAVGVLRYRIEVIVEDDSDTSTFVIFEKAGEKLLKTTASDLAAKSDVPENDDFGEIVPQAIQDIVGGVFLFYVKVAKYNFTAKHQSFSVYQIAPPPNALTKKRNETCEPSQTKSTKLPIAPPSNATLEMKPKSGCPLSKKPPTNRKNKSQVVVDETEE